MLSTKCAYKSYIFNTCVWIGFGIEKPTKDDITSNQTIKVHVKKMSSGSFKNVINKMCTQIISNTYVLRGFGIK